MVLRTTFDNNIVLITSHMSHTPGAGDIAVCFYGSLKT